MLVKNNNTWPNIFMKVHLLVYHTSIKRSLMHGHGTHKYHKRRYTNLLPQYKSQSNKRHQHGWRMKDQLDVTCYFISLICRLQPAKRTPPNTNRNKSSNTQRTENKTTDVVIHQHSRKLLKMDILMSEKCWAHNKWNKIASDIKLVFLSSTIAMMHGPINIRLTHKLISWRIQRM
jgi:hypothetical protein